MTRPVDALQVVVDVAEVIVELARDRFEAAFADLVDGFEQRGDDPVEVEGLALEPVDLLDRVGPLGGEDLALDCLDLAVERLGDVAVIVDHVVEDRVEDDAGAVGEQVGAMLDPLPDRAQRALAMADGDDEVGVDEEQQLADFHRVAGIGAVDRLDDDQQGVAEELDLGPLLGLDRVLDSELVQVELA